MGQEGLIIRLEGLERLHAEARRPALIRKACRLALHGRRGELGVRILGRADMLKLNREFLGHDYDTDVIAFPYEAEPGLASARARRSWRGRAASFPDWEPLSEIGDVCVSAFLARRQAKEQGHSVLTEVLTLVLHGCLHLAGSDDSTPRKRARMFARQDTLLSRIL